MSEEKNQITPEESKEPSKPEEATAPETPSNNTATKSEDVAEADSAVNLKDVAEADPQKNQDGTKDATEVKSVDESEQGELESDQTDQGSEEEVSAEEEPEKEEDDEGPAEEEPEKAEVEEAEVVEVGSAEEEPADEEPEAYYRKLADRAEGLLDLSDRAQATAEFGDINYLWEDGPDPEGSDLSEYRRRIDDSRDELERLKREHYEEQKRRREANLEKKKEILRSLRMIVDQGEWGRTNDVRRLKNRWDKIRAVPAEHAEDLEKKFGALLEEFNNHKVERLVEQKQKEDENLLGKLLILGKLEQFLKELDPSSDWERLEVEFEVLSKQFRKIGKVPSEKNQDVWAQYHELQNRFASERFKHDKKYKQKIENALKKKRKLIDEAEALLDHEDLAEAASKVNKLHRKWKKAGNLPQKDENELWDRFKAATDAFNEKKSENIDDLREQEEQNLAGKERLIAKAVELQESEDWDKTHHAMQSLMAEWKKIGPVPRKKTGKVWNSFKKAMDHFYDKRRDHFKDAKKERKENLKEKEQIIEELKKLVDHEDPIAAVDIAKPLQESFKQAGYVPIKQKNRLWQEYREACDKIYERFRAAKDAERIVGRENIDKVSSGDISKIRDLKLKLSKVQKEVQRLRQELIQKKESLSYFKPSGSGSSLLDQVKKNISDSEKKITKKEKDIVRLDTEINMLTRGAEEASSVDKANASD